MTYAGVTVPQCPHVYLLAFGLDVGLYTDYPGIRRSDGDMCPPLKWGHLSC